MLGIAIAANHKDKRVISGKKSAAIFYLAYGLVPSTLIGLIDSKHLKAFGVEPTEAKGASVVDRW